MNKFDEELQQLQSKAVQREEQAIKCMSRITDYLKLKEIVGGESSYCVQIENEITYLRHNLEYLMKQADSYIDQYNDYIREHGKDFEKCDTYQRLPYCLTYLQAKVHNEN